MVYIQNDLDMSILYWFGAISIESLNYEVIGQLNCLEYYFASYTTDCK